MREKILDAVFSHRGCHLPDGLIVSEEGPVAVMFIKPIVMAQPTMLEPDSVPAEVVTSVANGFSG